MTVAEEAVVKAPAYPTRRDEAWRYAPHSLLGRLRFGPPTGPVEVPDELRARIPPVDGPRIVVVNGSVDPDHSDVADLPDGLELLALASAADHHPGDIAEHPAAVVDGPTDAFLSLHHSYSRDGAFIRVAAGRQIEPPIHVVHVVAPDAPAGEGEANATCTGAVIRVEDGGAATVIETHLGVGSSFGGANARSSVTVGSGATLTHLILQDLPADQVQLSRIEVHQEGGSEYRGRSFNLGAAYGRVDYQVKLAGEGATADLAGLYFGFGDQTLDQQITVIHDAKDCVSRQSFRGVLDDSSTGVFNGGIMVSPGADGTDAEQANDNLILSMQAEVNTQPRLEILADDVACKHGATVGQLDETALYYLRSRGIPAEEARQLLIAGFAEQTVDEIRFEAVRAWIVERLGHGHA